MHRAYRRTERGTPTTRSISDIVPDQRFILTYWMHIDDAPISASLQTVAFAPDGAGTLLTFTEQAAFLDGFDGPDSRQEGTAIASGPTGSGNRRLKPYEG